ncbi:MAG: M23 family metallopeptidase [Bacteroidales bacterium]|nr:M23 family metallopeptidase [Bacteroidales bacterium]
MSEELYEYDSKSLRLRKRRRNTRKALGIAFRYLAAVLAFLIIFYLIFESFFTTEKEKELIAKNALYEQSYSDLRASEKALAARIEILRERDDSIYRELFHTAAPKLNPSGAADLIPESDSLSDGFFLSYSAEKAVRVVKMAGNVESNFKEIFANLEARKDSIPPLRFPLAEASYDRIGASVGEKLNPFYGVPSSHDGIDLMCRLGEKVYASADGTVSSVVHSTTGIGTMVEITHKGGYVTRYGCLSEVFVSSGSKVRAGDKLGAVGVSGKSFAPHLHYEVLRRGKVLDPVHHFFASVTPQQYSDMLYMAAGTGQSMD